MGSEFTAPPGKDRPTSLPAQRLPWLPLARSLPPQLCSPAFPQACPATQHELPQCLLDKGQFSGVFTDSRMWVPVSHQIQEHLPWDEDRGEGGWASENNVPTVYPVPDPWGVELLNSLPTF